MRYGKWVPDMTGWSESPSELCCGIEFGIDLLTLLDNGQWKVTPGARQSPR